MRCLWKILYIYKHFEISQDDTHGRKTTCVSFKFVYFATCILIVYLCRCDICGKGFQQAYKLRNHKMTHERKGVGVKIEPIEVETLESYHEVVTATTQILEI